MYGNRPGVFGLGLCPMSHLPRVGPVQLKKLFDEFDEDGGGTIDTAELGLVMERCVFPN